MEGVVTIVLPKRFRTMRIQRWLAILVLTAAGCSAPAASSVAPATFEEFAANACDAFSAMFRAVGNPDAGTDSELSKALDEAIRRGRSRRDRSPGAGHHDRARKRPAGGVAGVGLAAWFRDDEPARSRLAGIRGEDRRKAPGCVEPGRVGPSSRVRRGRWSRCVGGDVRGCSCDTKRAPSQPASARMRGPSDQLLICVSAPRRWTQPHEPGTCRFHGTGRGSR
jgi:hypothetical protein